MWLQLCYMLYFIDNIDLCRYFPFSAATLQCTLLLTSYIFLVKIINKNNCPKFFLQETIQVLINSNIHFVLSVP